MAEPASLKELFSQLKLEEKYLKAFEEEEIDLDALPALPADVIATLVPKLGPRAKLQEYIANVKVRPLGMSSPKAFVGNDGDLIDLPPASDEFAAVDTIAKASMNNQIQCYNKERTEKGLLPIVFAVCGAQRIVNKRLLDLFNAKREELAKLGRTADQLRVRKGFHGTHPRNIKVGAIGNPSSAVDEGFFGCPRRGVYMGRYPDYCLKYSNDLERLVPGDKARLVMFDVLPGKSKHIPGKQPGTAPAEGYDSHSSPNYHEWYLFDSAQCLPTYVIELRALENARIDEDDTVAYKTPAGSQVPLAEDQDSAIKQLAEAERCYQQGFACAEGKDVPQDWKEAVVWYRKAAELGHAEGQFQLGRCYLSGKGVEDNGKEAIAWLRKAAEQGHAGASNGLGACHELGKGVEKDEKMAVEWFAKAAAQGDAAAQSNLAFCYHDGQGVEKDEKKAAEWFAKAAAQGHAVAQRCLAVCYEDGKGVEKDEKKAVEWYAKAAAQGDAVAQASLGFRYFDGKGVKKDENKAVEWYAKAAAQGLATAQRSLAACYEFGRGVEKDENKAVEWYTKAAAQGDASAQCDVLAFCYLKGQGVEKDDKQTAEWFAKAAAQGDAAAQSNLAFCYLKGQGVEKDDKQAAEWFAKAAAQGLAAAQYSLGLCYANGFGVQKDEKQAAEWYGKAAAQGDEDASKTLTRLNAKDRSIIGVLRRLWRG